VRALQDDRTGRRRAGEGPSGGQVRQGQRGQQPGNRFSVRHHVHPDADRLQERRSRGQDPRVPSAAGSGSHGSENQVNGE